jgi:uncharacterized membrane protein YphA (DoxX/SURF4 family)
VVLVVEHGTSRGGRWLRRYRTRTALWIAVVEAALILFGVIPKWPAFFLAAALIVFWAIVGRNVRSDTLRQATWIGAASQLMIAALPFLIAVLTFAAFVALAILAIVALAFLFLDRS